MFCIDRSDVCDLLSKVFEWLIYDRADGCLSVSWRDFWLPRNVKLLMSGEMSLSSYHF